MRAPLDPTRLADPAVEVLPATPSTNAVVADRARQGGPEWLVVATEHQTAGRGRLDRVWETPDRAALTFSVLLRPRGPAGEWPWLPLMAGLAVRDTLRAAGAPAVLKWPNDVLLPRPDGTSGAYAKTAGILVERIETPAGAAAVLGIGLNVSQAADELPVDTATSVALATGTAPDRTTLLVALLGALGDRYAVWSAGGGAALRTDYRDACVTVGQHVRVLLPGEGDLTGVVDDVDAGGRLVVDGRPVAAGDVVHVRPAR